MTRVRVIPVLLLRGAGLVKTKAFKDPVYVGDPINAVRIFNEKEVDELALLDITASVQGKEPPYQLISDIASECFMPLAYGGGIKNAEQVKRIFGLGVEKVILNSHAIETPGLIAEAAALAGSQSIVVSIDVKRGLLGGYRVHTHSGSKKRDLDPIAWAKRAEELGAGEILLNSIDRDGSMEGYDLALIKAVSRGISIPLIACGGAGNVDDLSAAVGVGGASAVAAGSMFVFHGKHRAVLINFPTQQDLQRVFSARLSDGTGFTG